MVLGNCAPHTEIGSYCSPSSPSSCPSFFVSPAFSSALISLQLQPMVSQQPQPIGPPIYDSNAHKLSGIAARATAAYSYEYQYR